VGDVAKRLAAARAMIDAKFRAQQETPQPQTAAPARPAPAPVQTAAQQPPPAATQPETRPDPTPVRNDPPPQVAESRPEPARAQPQVERAREGDLVPAGTAGLTPPRIIRRGSVTYQAMARSQRVQGTVITSVLVSESGSVLDVRIIRGIGRPVGLDEAAEQAMRRSTFAPGTKDGVRVRSWLTVPVEFKL
ncbi:MAG: energy transducer TonB, partial [Thermoanaerobaculia bacterium]